MGFEALGLCDVLLIGSQQKLSKLKQNTMKL